MQIQEDVGTDVNASIVNNLISLPDLRVWSSRSRQPFLTLVPSLFRKVERDMFLCSSGKAGLPQICISLTCTLSMLWHQLP